MSNLDYRRIPSVLFATMALAACTLTDDDADPSDDSTVMGPDDDTTESGDDSTPAADDTSASDDDSLSGHPGPHMKWIFNVAWSAGTVEFPDASQGGYGTEPQASHVVPGGGDSCSPFWLVGDTSTDGSTVDYMIELRFPTPFAAGAASDLSILAEDEVWDHAVRPLTWWDEANGHVYVWRSGWATVEEYADTRMAVRFTAGEVCELDSAWPQGAYWEYNCAQDEVLLTLDTWREPDGVDFLSIPDWLALQVAKHPVSCQTDEVEALGWCLCTLDSYP